MGRNQQPLHLVPEKDALMAAAAAAAKVQGDGFWRRIGLELVRYGGARFLMTTVVAFASNKLNRGIKFDSNTEDSSEETLRSELNVSNEKLVTKTNASIEKFASEWKVSNEQLATKTDASLEKFASEWTVSNEQLATKTNASLEKFASDLKVRNEKHVTKTDTSIAELIVITEKLARELKIKNAKLSKLETKIENLNAEIHAMKMNVERPTADSWRSEEYHS